MIHIVPVAFTYFTGRNAHLVIGSDYGNLITALQLAYSSLRYDQRTLFQTCLGSNATVLARRRVLLGLGKMPARRMAPVVLVNLCVSDEESPRMRVCLFRWPESTAVRADSPPRRAQTGLGGVSRSRGYSCSLAVK